MRPLGVRWTIGDVSNNGWEALRLAVLGARQVFGSTASYAVCVNSVPVEVARARLGEVGDGVEWLGVSRDDLPAALRHRLDEGMAEGVAWKLAPLRVFPERWEISLDNDCILWALPAGMQAWLERGAPRQCLLAEDAAALYGHFAAQCGPEPRNAGIRGLPPGYPLEEVLARLLGGLTTTLSSELDEQGLQVAAASAYEAPEVVSIDDVTICSPFPPHRTRLGRCGAHFVGLNARHFSWQLHGRYAEEHIQDNWDRLRPQVEAHLGYTQAPPRSLP